MIRFLNCTSGSSCPISQAEYDECLALAKEISTGTVSSLNYIQSTGRELIDLGVPFDKDTRLILDIECTSKNNWQMFVCDAAGNNSHSFAIQDNTQNTRGGFDVWLNNESIRTSMNIARRMTLDFNKNKFYIDTVLKKTFSSTSWTPVGNIKLFNNSVMKLYSCKVYKKDSLVLALYPAKNEVGEVFLQDSITKKEYKNTGSGAFIGG